VTRNTYQRTCICTKCGCVVGTVKVGGGLKEVAGMCTACFADNVVTRYQESCREKGRKGGKATGDRKRRSLEHYSDMGRKSGEAKRKKRTPPET
jgi:general stress protein YciG